MSVVIHHKSDDVSKVFAIGQLGKRHDVKVIRTLESLNVTISVITFDAEPR